MDIVSYSHARQNLSSLMDKVTEDRAPVTVTRKGAEPVVVVSQSEWNSIQETLYLLSNPANAAHLRRSIAQLEAGDTVEWTPPE
ncbi:MAG TPA: type II toxin-antitoxin system Phd/YefM family antitoxin [Azospirillaceae bacterium]|nr:type II toxin-antitoxin system Phd/YefM family antitoxin [Azospirillaceae bacterium]